MTLRRRSLLAVLAAACLLPAGAPARADVANLPPAHRRLLSDYIRRRAQVFEGIEDHLKSTKLAGGSVNSAFGRLDSILDSGLRQIETDLKSAKPDAAAALQALQQTYQAEQRQLPHTQALANLLLKFHDELLDAMYVIERAAEKVERRRRRYVGYAGIVSSAVTSIRNTGVAGTLAALALGKPPSEEISLAISVALKTVDDLLKMGKTKEALAELLDYGVRRETAQLEHFLQERDPKKWNQRLSGIDRPRVHVTGTHLAAYKAYQKKWGQALAKHVAAYRSTYDTFKDAVAKKWLEFYQDLPRAKLAGYRLALKDLAARRRQLADRQDEVDDALKAAAKKAAQLAKEK